MRVYDRTIPAQLMTVLVGLFVIGCGGDSSGGLQSGDVLFQDFPSPQTEAIKIATNSDYSHCGLLFYEGDQAMVWEAVQPVKVTPFDEWVGRAPDSHFVAMRLIGADTLLDAATLQRMQDYARPFMGRDYDLVFAWDDQRFYCSELVWKMYTNGAGIELCPTRELGDYILSHPVVQQKLKERYGSNVPLEQEVVAPADLFNSERLRLVDQPIP
ncbi:YiiX family permuted papain-like enzyme [candidate division GN15 bacterium]|nr:YiiX family permuted papain-like enzyme [candidate division GN15 bacterium]